MTAEDPSRHHRASSGPAAEPDAGWGYRATIGCEQLRDQPARPTPGHARSQAPSSRPCPPFVGGNRTISAAGLRCVGDDQFVDQEPIIVVVLTQQPAESVAQYLQVQAPQ